MTDQLQTLADDISFLKALALEERSPALLGGSTLVAAGSVYGLASLAHWGVVTGLIPAATPWVFPALWGAATVVFLALLAVIRRRLRGARPVGAASRASGVAWQGVGWTIFTLSACIGVVAWRVHSDAPTLLFPPITLALYGLAWMVAAAVSRVGWMGLAAAGSYAAALLTALICASPAVFLVYAGALALLAIVPGLAMIRRARAGA